MSEPPRRTGQDEFLATVRRSLTGRLAGGDEASTPLRVSSTLASDQLADRLAQELEVVGGTVLRARSVAEAQSAMVNVLRQRNVTRVVMGTGSVIEEVGLETALAAAGFEVKVCDLTRPTPARVIRDAEFAADAGITAIDGGVAETGTLVVRSRSGQGRAVSLLPPLHVGILRRGDIVFELGELFDRIAADPPSALTLITGPSRTGDIELVLTVGVHGPGELCLLVVDF